ncbi:MAG TPA: OmpH family outer membrane protein [Thermoanaerobaculia bacterium]|nr:OmpH family outer membrane protein [Thermoanaerobaculia bacterium]
MTEHRIHGSSRRLASLASIALVLAALLAGTAGAQENPKLGVIDVERILEESVAGKAVIEQLKQLQDSKRAELQAKKDGLDQLRQRYSESRLTLAEDKLAEMEKQLEDMAIELQRAQDDAQRDMQKRQAEAFGGIETRVLPIIDQVGKELGFTLIFNKYQSGLLFAADGVDITDVVIQRFDQGS